MTQYFFVVAAQTGKSGVKVPLEQTVKDVKSILEGKFDSYDPEEFLFIGSLEDVTKKTEEATGTTDIGLRAQFEAKKAREAADKTKVVLDNNPEEEKKESKFKNFFKKEPKEK